MKHSEEQAALLRTIFLVQDKCLYLKREMNDVTGLLLMHKVLKASPRELDFVGMKVSCYYSITLFHLLYFIYFV